MQSDPTPQPDPEVLGRIEELAIEMAVASGRILTEHFGKSIDVEFKSDDKTNPVSQADKESEEYLKSTISSRFPDHRILGEEGTDTGAVDADFLWALDPLDGTVNYLNGFPIYAVSIGVLYKGQPVAGSIWTPFSGNAEGSLYHARLGQGAFKDGERISVRRTSAPMPGKLMIMPLMFRRRFHQKAGPKAPLGEGRNLGSIAYEMAGHSIWDAPVLSVHVAQHLGHCGWHSAGQRGRRGNSHLRLSQKYLAALDALHYRKSDRPEGPTTYPKLEEIDHGG